MDGRLFIVDMVEQQGILPHETIMNLPQTATDFLDVFIGFRTRYVKYLETQSKLSKDEQEKKLQAFFVPRINVYAFSTHPTEPIVDIVERCAHVMRCKPEDIIDYEGHIVRDVAPKKVMVCLSFPVPKIVAEAEPLTEFGTHIQHSKKRSAEDMLQEEEH